MKEKFIIPVFNVKGNVELSPYSDLATVIMDKFDYGYDSEFVQAVNTYVWESTKYVYSTAHIEELAEKMSKQYDVIVIYNKNDKMPKNDFETPGTYYNAMSERLMQSSKEDVNEAEFSIEIYEPLNKGKTRDNGDYETRLLANSLAKTATVYRYGYNVGMYLVEPEFEYHVNNEGTYRGLPKQEVRPYAAKGMDKEVADLLFDADAAGVFFDYDVIYYKGHPSRFRDTECEADTFNGFESNVEDFDEDVFNEDDPEDPDAWMDEEPEEETEYGSFDELYTEDEYFSPQSEQERQLMSLGLNREEYDFDETGMYYKPYLNVPIAYDDYYNEELTREDWYEYRAAAEKIIEEDYEKLAAYSVAWNKHLEELKTWKATQKKLEAELRTTCTKVVKRGSNKPPVFIYKADNTK